ncbi:MAG: hypothetical protein V4712_17665 [Pseudomonadota bacterium]
MGSDKPSRADLARLGGNNLLDAGSPGGQLDMFGDDKGAAVPVEARVGPGRPAGSGNRLKAKLRDYMAAQGYRDPAAQLAMLAGLDRPDLHPLGYAAQIAAQLGEPVTAVAGLMRQAAAELMPYWHARITPDVAITTPAVNILMAGPGGIASMQGDGDDPFAPLDVRLARNSESQQFQQVSDGAPDSSDGDIRTQEVRP